MGSLTHMRTRGTTAALIAAAVLFASVPSLALAADNGTEAVKTANYFLLSGGALEKPATLEALATFDLLVLPAEAQVFNRHFFADVRAKNPDIKILAYVPTVSWNNLFWSDALHIKQKKGIQESWWLRDASGSKKSVWPNTTALNLTSGWKEYLANFVANEVMSTGYWDGVFYDEVGDSIDWVGALDVDTNGVNDRGTDANAAWARAYVDLFKNTRELLPSAIIITNGSSNRAFAPYVNGRMFETFPSSDKPLAQWSGSAREYLNYEDALTRTPVNVVNVNSDNTGINTDYRKVRFGIATTLLGDGYFSYDFGTQNHAQTWRFDEYDIYLGTAKGNAERTDGTGTSISQGVWEREYTNGKVLVNATGMEQTVRLDGEYEKVHGTQDPAVNDGRFVSRVTLGAQDGLILLRPLEVIENTTFVNGAFARIFNKDGGTKRTGFFAYDAIARGGTRVVRFDTDLDGVLETIVADDTFVTIYDNGQVFAKFAPYTDKYKQGVNIAIADLEGDGTVEIVTGTERGGGPQLRIFNKNGVLIHPGFFAYDTAFRGGVNVALGDLNGDGTIEIVAGAGVGGGPHVRVFNKDGKLINPGFFAYDPKFRGGVNVAVADVDGDGKDDIVTGPGKGGGPHVRVFDKDGKMKGQFFAFDQAEANGLEVAATDIDGDGRAEIIGLSSDVFTLSTR